MPHNNTLSRIWQKPKYLPYVHEPLTASMIQQAESTLGHALPKEYLDILNIQNGGYIAYGLEDHPHSQIFGIGNKFPSITDFDPDELQEYVSYPLQGLVPFDGDGHWYLCLDYRTQTDQPQICMIDIECDEQQLIADNFAEYLKLLKFQCDDEIVIRSDLSLPQLASKVASILQIQFEQPDDFAHGYPVYRSKIKNDWIWLQANQVPVAFIRENEKDYEKLKHLMESYTVKHPELDENSFIVDASEEKRCHRIFEQLQNEFSEISYLRDVIPAHLIPR